MEVVIIFSHSISPPTHTHTHSTISTNTPTVKLILRVGSLHDLFVRLFQILRQHNVPILSNRLQSRLLANRRDISAANLLRPIHERLQIHLIAQIHLRRARLEHQTLLPPIRKREFHFSVQSSGSHERGVQHFGAIRGHDHLHVRRLVESVHLRQQFH